MRSLIQKLSLSLLLAFTITTLSAQKKVCFTIDDLPVVDYGMKSLEEWQMITDRLLSKCEQYGIPAIGFVNEGKIHKNGVLDTDKAQLIESWLKRGFDLGNHTFSHPDYHKVGYDAFTKNVIEGERYTKPLMARYDKELKYFRHPFLRSGATKASSDSLETFLRGRGYQPSPVTLDSDDYMFAQQYARALRKGDSTRMKRLGEAYVKRTEDMLHFYEKLSKATFGRDIDHTYLMHASLLNADYLDELVAMFKRNGYEFASQEEVLKDPAYQEPVTKFGGWGISWMYRWAMSTGKGTELFKEEVPLPEILKQ